MKTLLVALAATGLAITAFPQTSDAHSKKYHKYGKHHGSHSSHRRYSKRDYDRLPLNKTNAPDTGAYQYRDFPLWAARSFAPNDGTR